MNFGAFGRGRLQHRALVGLAVAAVMAMVIAAAVLRPSGDARAALRSGDYRAAHAALPQPAEGGDAWSQNALGNLYYLGLGTGTDYRAAVGWYWRAASQGYAEAQINLGHLYAQGLGVPRDWIRAYTWYLHAARGSEYARELVRLIDSSHYLHMTVGQVQRAWEEYGSIESLEP